MRHILHGLLLAFLWTWAPVDTVGWAGEPTAPSDGAAQGPSRWTVALDAIPWTAAVEEVGADRRPRPVVRLDGQANDSTRPEEKAYLAEARDGRVAFEVVGRLPSPRAMVWRGTVRAPAPHGPYAYYRLRYRARGIERSRAPVGVVSVAERGGDGEPASLALLTVDQVLNDDRWHVAVGKKAVDFPVETLRVEVATTGSLGRFEIGELSFYDSLPEVEAQLAGPSPIASGAEPRFACLDLADLCNDDCAGSFRRLLDAHGMVVDGGNRFAPLASGNRTAAAGIPFAIADGEHDLVRPPEDPKRNAEEVDLLGTKTTRHYWKPHGRDDPIRVPVGHRTSEVFFIMAAELPPSESCYARPSWPRPVDDIEALAVELQYADGEPDFAFPYSLADGGFRVRRALGAYVVPADPERVLANVVLHNRRPGGTFSLAAVTVNTSTRRLVPEVLLSGPPVRVPRPPRPPERRAAIRRNGDLLRLGNTHYDLVVDCRRGFSIASMNHRASRAEIRLHPSSGLEVELGDTVLTGRAFRTQSVQVEGRSATIRLQSEAPSIPLALSVRLAVDDTPQVTMNLTAESTGSAPVEATVRFPVLREVTIGACADTWMFFPQYRSVIDNRPGTYYVPNDCRFPLQVFDVYNPGAGVGLGVITHNRDRRSLDYSMGKTERGVTAFVQSPGELYRIEAGGSVALVEACLVFHRGDWHEALAAYRGWLEKEGAGAFRAKRSTAGSGQSGPSPFPRPHARDWFRRVFLLRCHQAKKFYAWAVPIYDPETGAYRIDEFVRADVDYLGMTPQVFHLFGWTDLDNGWRGHPNGDYRVASYTGGPAALKAAIRRLEEEHGIRASLYTISDRCYKQSAFGRKHGERLARRRKDGSPLKDEFNWYVCGNAQAWRDHYVESLCRTQRETGVEVLYVDVFPYSRSSPCYSPEHGHEVPSHVDRGTYALIRQLRERLPDEVAIWSEYPLPDAAAPYIDGNIHYYCLDWHEHFGKTYDRPDAAPAFAATAQNVYRYAFPELKQFVFLCGIRPWSGDSKFPFFGGEALYDCSWSLYAGRNLDRVKRALAIQRRYDDCFASLRPIPEVATRRREVHANCFPGRGRTAWTLFNARYTTVRGPVLDVAHRPGATYRDAWNDVPLDPPIVDGRAVLSLTLHPQQLGCIVQTWKGN